MVERFKTIYKNDCPEYIDYFEEYYLNRSKEWAMWYRTFPHGDTDTNMYVESLHNLIKTYYMKRIPNKRLDVLLNLLIT